MKKVLIAGGSGLIGRRLTLLLQSQGHEVSWLSRNKSSSTGVRTYTWNPARTEIPEDAVKDTDVIISLAGSSVAGGRWTSAYKKEILDSRLDTAKTIRQALHELPHHVQCLLCASAIGYYGNRGDLLLTEASGTGTGFLSESVDVWEKAYDSSAIRTVILRTGIVLSREGGALPEMVAPMKAGLCTILGNGKQYMSWIHIDDLCRLFLYALTNESMEGTFNAVAPVPVTHRDFMFCLRKKVAPYSIPVPVPAFALRAILGEKSAIVLDSTKVSASRILNAGFTFKHSELQSALSSLYV